MDRWMNDEVAHNKSHWLKQFNEIEGGAEILDSE